MPQGADISERGNMAYFVRIGAIKQNKTGVGSRGYQLFRRQRSVVTRWGAVKVDPGRKFSWCHTPQEKIFQYRSERAARERLQEFVRRRIESQGYSRLPRGARITK